MTLEATIQDKAKIPEGLADHYVETDGVFVLAVNGLKSQKDFDDYAEALKKRLTDAGADLARKHGPGRGRDAVGDQLAPLARLHTSPMRPGRVDPARRAIPHRFALPGGPLDSRGVQVGE